MFQWLKKLFRTTATSSENKNTPNDIPAEHQPQVFTGDESVSENSSEFLIEYLRLKSKQTRIKKDVFNLNNVLNELSGSLSSNFMDSGIELIFDINNDVPKDLIGDSLQLGKILESLTRSIIQKNPQAEIEIRISFSKTLLSESKIVFTIVDPEVYLTEEELAAFKVPYYDEEQSEYLKLEFYVTKEIVSLMGGTLDIKSHQNDGTVMKLSIPFELENKEDKRKYRLPSKEWVGKKVFLVDNNYQSAMAIKKMLAYFQYTVDVLSSEYFKEKKVDLSSYDIAIFDEQLLAPHVVSYLKNLKMRNHIKIVLLSSIFRSKHKEEYDMLGVVDVSADKPFTQERVYEMILDLDRASNRNETRATRAVESDSASEKRLVHRELFEEKVGVDAESFADFAGRSVLVVDDNRINQKILLHVLGKSTMQLDLASNGEEALLKVLEREAPYDMILMDINMPIMDGYTATAEIRKKSKHKDVPIVALTTLILEHEIEKMFAHGVSGYLSKPLEVGRLYTALDYFVPKSDIAATLPKKKILERKYFDGLDVAQGTRYAKGNTMLYKEILHEFLAAYGQSAQLMRMLVDTRDYAQVKFLCTDMRSLSNTIGAYKMYAVVDEIYKALLYDDEQNVHQYVEPYRRELERLRDSIGEYTKREPING